MNRSEKYYIKNWKVMLYKTLIIDNDTRFSHGLQESLPDFATIISDLSTTVDRVLEYDIYIIRFDPKTDTLIQELAKNNKLIIILTNKDTQSVREKILTYNITDYIVTNCQISKIFVVKTVQRIIQNSKKTILIVDDSKVILNKITMLLKIQNINYIECNNGKEALDYLDNPESKKIDLLMTDYEMPIINGYELVKKIRDNYSLEELPILVLSGSEDTYMISRFLKAGANDYITKPFLNEEFLARINNAISLSDMFEKVKNMAMTDQLTGLHNRTYFYDAGVKVLEMLQRAKQPLAIAMIDIDNFKKINDTYGHEVGDRALIHVASTITEALRKSDIFVRFGGEEFVILLPNCSHENALKTTNKICKIVADSTFTIDKQTSIQITISIGVATKTDTVDNMLNTADKLMYQAKQNGKNRVYTE